MPILVFAQPYAGTAGTASCSSRLHGLSSNAWMFSCLSEGQHEAIMRTQGAGSLQLPLHLQVSQASAKAKEAIEAKGGSVTTVYYNRLGLRALLQPDWFERKGKWQQQ